MMTPMYQVRNAREERSFTPRTRDQHFRFLTSMYRLKPLRLESVVLSSPATNSPSPSEFSSLNLLTSRLLISGMNLPCASRVLLSRAPELIESLQPNPDRTAGPFRSHLPDWLFLHCQSTRHFFFSTRSSLLFQPESPRYLVLKGRTDEAKASLARLRGQPVESEFVQAEFDDISGAYAHELSLGEASFKACFQGNMAKRTWAGILGE